MARQESACWHCGAQWAAEEPPPLTLRVIAGGQSAPRVADLAETQAGLLTDAWVDDGGSVGPARVAAGLRGAAATW
jgi:hypothetical protein